LKQPDLRGESSFYILYREILPNVLPHLAVEASMRFSYSIFLVASLGFLGLGVQPPSPDWGLMVGEARTWFYQANGFFFSRQAQSLCLWLQSVL
jgi:peptide/nickel transport system permease protein